METSTCCTLGNLKLCGNNASQEKTLNVTFFSKLNVDFENIRINKVLSGVTYTTYIYAYGGKITHKK